MIALGVVVHGFSFLLHLPPSYFEVRDEAIQPRLSLISHPEPGKVTVAAGCGGGNRKEARARTTHVGIPLTHVVM